jgi:hypothetical protein
MGKHNELSLKKKVELIEAASVSNQRGLATAFNISLGTVSNILKRKSEILQTWQDSDNSDSKRTAIKGHFKDVNENVWLWFKEARSRNVQISGQIIQEKARIIASLLGVNEFKALNGWLEAFSKRHQILFRSICKEEISVKESTVQEWKIKINSLLTGYEIRDIFNCDENAIFFRALPNKLVVEKESLVKKGSKPMSGLLSCAQVVQE